MITVTICVGSSCSVRGSDVLAGALEDLIEKENLNHQVVLVGAFCMELCSMGVSIRVNDRQYREIRPEQAKQFFYEEIVPLVQGKGQHG